MGGLLRVELLDVPGGTKKTWGRGRGKEEGGRTSENGAPKPDKRERCEIHTEGRYKGRDLVKKRGVGVFWNSREITNPREVLGLFSPDNETVQSEAQYGKRNRSSESIGAKASPKVGSG